MFQHMKTTKRTDSEDNTASTVTTATWDDHDSDISGTALYGDDHHMQHHHSFGKTKHAREPISRRGGVLFQESSDYDLHPVRYSNAKKGCMKVASLEDSLRSCLLHKEQEEQKPKRRTSLNLESLTSSLRNLIQPSPRGCVSCSHSLDNTEHADDTDITMESSDSTLSHCCRETKVRFTEISIRRYPVAPDDNPSATGKSAAIALSGWQYETTEPVSVEEYESKHRQGRPPKKMEDLKINWIERRRRLLEAGASSAEISAFARRIQKAKAQRQETAQELSLYGKKHVARLERQENMRHFFKRAIGLRKTNSKNQAALWDQAQKLDITV